MKFTLSEAEGFRRGFFIPLWKGGKELLSVIAGLRRFFSLHVPSLRACAFNRERMRGGIQKIS